MSTNPAPELTPDVWRQLIQNVAIKDPKTAEEHPWICYTYNEKRERLISILSPEKYRELSSQNSILWGNQCEKIPLTELIATTQRLKSLKVDQLLFSERSLGLRVSKLFMDDAFQADWKAESLVDNWLKEWLPEKAQKEAETDEISSVIKALENMCLRSEAKREALKAKGLWNRFLLWFYLLFNEIPETKNLKVDSPGKQIEPDLSVTDAKKKICTLAQKYIRERIAINMEGFEENLPARLKRPEDKSKNWHEVIQHPKDVKSKWLLFYAEDKIPRENLSELGNTQRVRIQTLNKLWEDFQMYSRSIADAPS